MITQDRILDSFLILAAALLFIGVETQAKDNVILRFDFTNGANPTSALISDGQGNLYGTAKGGNKACYSGCGIVYELSPTAGGKWKETVLVEFLQFNEGFGPGSLIFGKDGTLYGTLGYADIYQLTNSNGQVKKKILYGFNQQQQGSTFGSQLVFDEKGNLYGSLQGGGPLNGGSVFELSPQADGTWNATILHSFGASGDGNGPVGGVVFDGKGNLYGTTAYGGSSGYGTVFELSPNANGSWSESILYNFSGGGDGYPSTPLTFGPDGNLFGTTDQTAFELSQKNGAWNLTTLYIFGNQDAHGNNSSSPSGLVFDASGNAYGVTSFGGNQCNTPGCGVVFKLAPESGGRWKEVLLHQFESAGDGSEVNFSGPAPTLLLDNSTGRLYGATIYGGDMDGDGTVFFVDTK